MTLDISGYNDNFKAFVEFAQQRKNANDANAVIDAHKTHWADARYSPSHNR